MEISEEIADRILQLVVSAEYRPAKPKQIAAQLNLDIDGYREVRRAVKQLVREGRLVYGSNHLVYSTGSIGGPQDRIRGTFARAMGGQFGFVRPHHTGNEKASGDDLFVPPGQTGGALEGDLVEIEVKPGRGGRNEGRVVEIIERARRQFTGTFRIVSGRASVQVDGLDGAEAVDIGDVRGLALESEDKVFVEMVNFPDPDGFGGEAVVLERLGSSKNPAIDTLVIMKQYGLSEEFRDDVLDDARVQSDAFDDSFVPEDRLDLTDKWTLTIDPKDARDFDDAISLDLEENGRLRLWVHIADVSHFVKPGSPLDVEARHRATSVYLPDRVIPMIPEIISNHLASLQPEKQRYVKTVEIEFQDDLTITHTRVHNAMIRSDIRLNYEQVDRYLEKPDEYQEKWGSETCELLSRMHGLAMKIRKKRFTSGSLSMDLPDTKLDIDRAGKVKGAYRVENTESHQIIEEFMLAANQAVAAWLDNLDLNFLHRIHPPPDRRKLRQLTMFVRDLGIKVESMESRFEIQRVLDKVSGTNLEDAVNFSVLRSMSKAVYGPEADGHYALDMEHYCHFTSPIRRYPDLTVHRLVNRLLEGEKRPDESMGTLVRLGHHCSDRERNAASAERDLIQLKLLHFLNKHLGETMKAVISRVFADGIHARSLKLPVDGFIPVDSLPPDQYHFERRGQILSGFKGGNQFRLGDQLVVKIHKVDLQTRQAFFKLMKNERAAASNATKKATPKMTGGRGTAKNKKRGKKDRGKGKSKRGPRK